MTPSVRLLCLIGGLFGLATGISGQDRAGAARQPSTADRRLAALHRRHPRHAGTRRSIRSTPSNFNKLEVAWRFKTDNLGPRPEYKLEGTPLMVNGVLYTTGGTRRSVVALDGKTGELIWAHSLREGQARRRLAAPAVRPRRLVLDRRHGRRAHPLRHDRLPARRAQREDRRADSVVRQERRRRSEGRRRVRQRRSRSISRPARSASLDAGRRQGRRRSSARRSAKARPSSTHNNTKGLVRAFDVRTGKLLWTFNTIPRPGEFGNDTWENDSWAVNGNTGVWTQITVDEELGLVYLPVETPTSDFYGGHRPGNNLFAESLVCVDLKTGQRKWHFQFVHHPIWNFDMSSAPMLADITVNGTRDQGGRGAEQAGVAVRVRSRHRPAGLADRRAAGAAVRRAGREDVADAAVPDQAAGLRAQLRCKVPDDLIDFTPELRAQALEAARSATRSAPCAVHPADARQRQRACSARSTWATRSAAPTGRAAAYDPETHIVFAQARTTPASRRDRWSRRRRDSRTSATCRASAGQPFREVLGPGDCCAADSPRAPAQRAAAPRPRRGRAAAAAGAGRRRRGRRPDRRRACRSSSRRTACSRRSTSIAASSMWQVPHGDTPDNVRNHPALQGHEHSEDRPGRHRRASA